MTQSADAQATGRTVLLTGATGLVGGLMLRALLADPGIARVHVLSRRTLSLAHPKLEVELVDFARLPALPHADEAYLALGTTIKVAGSQAAFRAVDFDANLAVAKAAKAAGCTRVGLVSAAGASARSSVFYSRVKGELEDALQVMDFEALVIARPGLLLDSREGLQQPPRLGEKLLGPIAKLLAPITPGVYRPVHAQAVALALVSTVATAKGVVVLASDAIAKMGAAP